MSSIESHFFASHLQYVHAVFTLRSSNDFTNLGNQNIGGSDRLLIFVQFHVEGLDIFRVIHQDDGLLVNLFAQVSLVFRWKINSPDRFFFEHNTVLFDSLLQNFNSFGVCQSLEGVVQDVLQSIPESDLSVGAVFKKFQVLLAVLESELHTVLEVVLGQVDVVGQIGETNLGFDHPKLGQVTSRVRVFGPKGWAEGVDVGQGAGVCFYVELPRHRQVDAFSKEIVGIVDGSYHLFVDGFGGVDLGLFLGSLLGSALQLTLGKLGSVFDRWRFDLRKLDIGGEVIRSQHRSHTKLLSGALAIGTGQDWGVNVQKTVVVEEVVCGVGHAVSDSHGRGVHSSTRSQVGVVSHVFQGVCFFAHGVKGSSDFRSLKVSSVDCTQELSSGDGQLDGLSRTLGGNEGSDHLKGGTGSTGGFALGETLTFFGIENALDRFSGRPIIEFYKEQLSLVGIACGSGPSGNRDGLVEILGSIVFQHFLDTDAMTPVQVGLDRSGYSVQHDSPSAAFGGEVAGKLVGRHGFTTPDFFFWGCRK
mmetsp:Transcript_15972/g.44172  ORF Transcript_15972/g.44172 Transcript_15972/m.44172 type:complete len:530 (-) Transcript_15972:142-1731(-)